MKFGTTILSLVSSSTLRPDGGPRRFSQMESWMEHFNPSFDNRDLYYGCHCFTTSDRPMSQMGKGAPLDAVDSVCLKYKQCLKCASQEFGDDCINEIVRYGANMNGDQPECTSRPGSCKRKLCECDKEFARTIVNEVSFLLLYLFYYFFSFFIVLFWSAGGFVPKGHFGHAVPKIGHAVPKK